MKNDILMVNMLKELYPHFEGTNSFLLEYPFPAFCSSTQSNTRLDSQPFSLPYIKQILLKTLGMHYVE